METALIPESTLKLLYWKNAYKVLTKGNMLCEKCEELIKTQIAMIDENIKEALGKEKCDFCDKPATDKIDIANPDGIRVGVPICESCKEDLFKGVNYAEK